MADVEAGLAEWSLKKVVEDQTDWRLDVRRF
jgi:hypothetical protein